VRVHGVQEAVDRVKAVLNLAALEAAEEATPPAVVAAVCAAVPISTTANTTGVAIIGTCTGGCCAASRLAWGTAVCTYCTRTAAADRH
jgi:hypothetical protein